jgi:hypothetical protein
METVKPYNQGGKVSSLGLNFIKTSGLPTVDSPNLTNRLDYGKYYAS